MKILLLISSIFLFSYCNAQSYIGLEITEPKYIGVVLLQEIDTTFVLMQTKTIISIDPRVQLKVGFILPNKRFTPVIYMPVFNLSLKEMKYNTPLEVAMRYKSKDFLFLLGSEIYLDKVYYYLNLLVEFK